MNRIIVLLLALTSIFVSSGLEEAFANEDVVVAPQVSVSFEDIDTNADEMLNNAEVKHAFSMLFDAKYKEDQAPALGSISFGTKSKQKSSQKAERNYNKGDFVESNTARLFGYDTNNDSVLSSDEYEVRNDYGYSKAECKAVIEQLESKPKTFSAVSDDILNGNSHKRHFCETKYK